MAQTRKDLRGRVLRKGESHVSYTHLPIGYWGMLRKEYLKKHKSGMYSYLL